MYDVIVVGARCAGATTALLLARAGHRVLLLDRARFPRDTLCTLFIEPRGIELLREWGVLDEVAAAGAPRLDRFGDLQLSGPAYAPRRLQLDQTLVRAAVAAGVEFRDGCSVTGLEFDADRVVGVRHRTGRVEVVERAGLVVGADGMRSQVAAAVRAPLLVNDAPRTCVYYSYFAGAAQQAELYVAPGSWVAAVPTSDGATVVQAYFPQSSYARVRAGAPAAFADEVRAVAPELWERMCVGGQVDRLYGTGDQRNFFRTAAGPGWVLVGDAGHHSDAITPRGITQAFRQSRLLADLLPPDLADKTRVRTALDMFAARRDEELSDEYRETLAVAELAAN